MLEERIETRLVHGVERAGGLVRKLVWLGRRHAPDRLVIMPAMTGTPWPRIYFVELKAPRKTPRPGQHREHDRLRAMGCKVFTLNTFEKVDKFLKDYC